MNPRESPPAIANFQDNGTGAHRTPTRNHASPTPPRPFAMARYVRLPRYAYVVACGRPRQSPTNAKPMGSSGGHAAQAAATSEMTNEGIATAQPEQTRTRRASTSAVNQSQRG